MNHPAHSTSLPNFSPHSFAEIEQVPSGGGKRSLLPALVGFAGILVGILLLGGAPTDLRAQNLPSWAEPGEHREQSRSRYYDETEREKNTPGRYPRGSGGIEHSDGIGAPIPMGRPGCSSDPSICNKNQICVNDRCVKDGGGCQGNGDCKKNETCVDGTCVKQNKVPIGGPWGSFWTGMLVVMGLSYGTYSLIETGELGKIDPDGAVLWTKILVLGGIGIGLFASLGGDLFAQASSCSSSLSILVPWSVYWGGLVAFMMLLVFGGKLTCTQVGKQRK